MSNIKNIALMAHVDAGKTTLTEQILFASGVIRSLGSVDEGTAKTDDLAIERQRGISVRATFTSLQFEHAVINLIDTPGHTDFYSQVERTFLAVDAIVVLVSAVDGIQSGTESILAEAAESHVPILFFINKCDRDAARKKEAADQLKDIKSGAFDYETERYETAALYDDDVLQAFLEGVPEDNDVTDKILRVQFRSCEIAPILSGSAYTGEGVAELLRSVCAVVPSPEADAGNKRLSGVVFSVLHDKQFGRGAYIRLFAGRLQVRDTVNINGGEYKISIIRQQTNGRWIDAKEINAGEIGLVYGLSECKTGDVFGDVDAMPERVLKGLTKKALLTAQIAPENESDNTALKAAIEMMAAEDPALEPAWDPISGQIHINIMGKMHVEALLALIEERFGMKVKIDEPFVIYKETLAGPAIGYDAYTMPKPSWAILEFHLSPAKRGSGISYTCTAAPNRIPYRYRDQVERSIIPSLKQGLYGWEVIDIDINLVDGEDHPIHTHPLDFTIATPLALMKGLQNGGTILLEPILDVRLTFDSTHLGRIMSDITRMRGRTEAQTYHGDAVTLTAYIPLASFLDYPIAFASITSGHGIMTQRFHEYGECPADLIKTRHRRGINPLDRSKYILAARSAMAGTVFDV